MFEMDLLLISIINPVARTHRLWCNNYSQTILIWKFGKA